jgi:hypothetical protein
MDDHVACGRQNRRGLSRQDFAGVTEVAQARGSVSGMFICGIEVAEAAMSILTGEHEVAIAFDAMVRRRGDGVPFGCDGWQDLA